MLERLECVRIAVQIERTRFSSRMVDVVENVLALSLFDTKKKGMTAPSLDIVFVRHAHSCGNAKEFSNRSKLYKLVKLQTKDPTISDLGVMQIQTALTATNIHDFTLQQFYQEAIDHVFCSDFMRACETALNLFPQQHVQVVPYIGEKSRSPLLVRLGIDLENATTTPTETIKRLHKMKYDLRHFSYDFYETIVKDKSAPTPNLKKFFEVVVLQHWMNPQSPFYLFHQKAHVRVAIVTHGHLMRDFFLQHTHFNATEFFAKKPIFANEHCQHQRFQDYVPRRIAVGNVSSFLMKAFTPTQIRRFLTRKLKFDVPMILYETNAVYDPITKTCMSYNDVRFLQSAEGRKHHVLRCEPHIRAISTLK